MKLKLSLEEAKAKVLDYMRLGYHCGPSVLKVMWEAYGMKNKDFLWAGTVFRGGIAGQQQAPCGAVSGGSLALGLKYRRSTKDWDKAEKAGNAACEDAAELVKSFQEKYGSITCEGLLGIDMSNREALKQAQDTGLFEKVCLPQVQFAIEKLYEIEEKHNRSASQRR
ncbi:MAG: C-GCAxxG-C-C family protein [Dehalococcoidales bacterium]